MADPAIEFAQLRWRCRRGMRELDVLLNRYLNVAYAAAPADQKTAFARLLELPDPEIMAYLLARDSAADQDIARLIAQIRRCT